MLAPQIGGQRNELERGQAEDADILDPDPRHSQLPAGTLERRLERQGCRSIPVQQSAPLSQSGRIDDFAPDWLASLRR
jgi:hypothetical protein